MNKAQVIIILLGLAVMVIALGFSYLVLWSGIFTSEEEEFIYVDESWLTRIYDVLVTEIPDKVRKVYSKIYN